MKNVNTSVDPLLQEELVSVMLNDHGYASKYVELINTGGQDRSLRIFSNQNLDIITNLYTELHEKNDGAFPTKGEMCDEIIKLNRNDSDKELIRKKFLSLKERNTEKREIHERKIVETVKAAKIIGFLNKSLKLMKTVGSVTAILEYEKDMQEFLSKLELVTFKKDDVVDMTDFGALIDQFASESSNNVKIGIEKICRELNGGGENGGIARQEITVLQSGTNDGKTIASNSALANALRHGHKAVVFSLEGKRLQTPMRIISNLTKINYKKLVRYRDFINKNDANKLAGYFSKEEMDSINKAQELWSEKVRVVHAIKNCEIEYIVNKVHSLYKDDPFDLLVIDYGQLVESVREFPREDMMMQYVFRTLEKTVSDLNVAGLIPMQVNRAGMISMQNDYDNGEEYPTYKLGHVAGGYATLKTAGCVITINRTVEERKEGKLRYCIAKQREGLVGVQVGLKARFDISDVSIGEEYYYFNPTDITSQSSSKPSLMDAFDETTSGVELDKLIESNEILKRLNEEKVDHDFDDFYDGLVTIKSQHELIDSSKKHKKEIQLGSVDCDDEDQEIDNIDSFITESQAKIYNIIESDNYLEQYEKLINGGKLLIYSNLLDTVLPHAEDLKNDYPDVYRKIQAIKIILELDEVS